MSCSEQFLPAFAQSWKFKHALTPGLSDILLQVEQISSDGNFSRTSHPGNIPSGLHYMILDLDGQIGHSSLLKL